MVRPENQLTVLQSYVRLGDPHVCSDAKNRLSILYAMCEALIRRDDAGVYHPSLARCWHVAEDARTWRFELRDDVTFHNGDRLRAADVVATLNRALDPALGGEMGTEGVYQSYLGGAEILALDDHTVRIVTAEPLADLLDILVALPIIPQSALADLPQAPVGSGPFRLVEAGEDAIVMEAFANYWGPAPTTERVVWRAQSDVRQRVTALLDGTAGLITALDLQAKTTLEAAEIQVPSIDSNLCVIFMYNMRTGPCTDPRVRQALNYAFDVSELIVDVKGGAAEPLSGPLTPLHFGYDPETLPYAYDPVRAHELLIDAGCCNDLHLVFDVPTRHPDEAPDLATFLAEQYQRVGVELDVRTYADREAYAYMVRDKEIHDACCFDSSPWSTYRVLREKFHSGVAGPWWQGYANPAVDSLIDRAAATVDDARRRALYRRAYRLIRDDAPWIFLYHPRIFWGVGPAARDWRPSADGVIRLR